MILPPGKRHSVGRLRENLGGAAARGAGQRPAVWWFSRLRGVEGKWETKSKYQPRDRGRRVWGFVGIEALVRPCTCGDFGDSLRTYVLD